MDHSGPHADHQALIELLVGEYQARLRSFLFAHTGDREVSDDLAQEVFLVALFRISEYDSSRPAWPWLLGIARNKVKEHWREAARERAIDPLDAFVAMKLATAADADPAAEIHEHRLQALRACLERLGDQSRRVVHMTYVERLSSYQIGEQLSKESTAVRVLLHRVRTRLGDCIRATLREALA